MAIRLWNQIDGGILMCLFIFFDEFFFFFFFLDGFLLAVIVYKAWYGACYEIGFINYSVLSRYIC